jgi:hypothetical protein
MTNVVPVEEFEISISRYKYCPSADHRDRQKNGQIFLTSPPWIRKATVSQFESGPVVGTRAVTHWPSGETPNLAATGVLSAPKSRGSTSVSSVGE